MAETPVRAARPADDPRALPAALLAYAAASLFHHAHNAVHVAAYPNLPAWLTATTVWKAWILVTAVGVLGYLWVRTGRTTFGLGVLALYALLGLAGLDHYARAPFAAHSPMMNLSIGAEVVTALVLLAVVTAGLAVRLRASRPRP